MAILQDKGLRAHQIYCAEWASGVATLWPLGSVHDAQVLATWVIKRPFWKKYSIVKDTKVSYAPRWDHDSACGWLPKEPRQAEMDLTLGSLCVGTVAHELGHLDKRDKDDGHRFAFLRFQFAIIEEISEIVAEVLLPRYALELRARNLVTGNEPWIKPHLK